MSFVVEVTDGSGYAANGLRFATEAAAEMYAIDLLLRWTGAQDYRIVKSPDAPDLTSRKVAQYEGAVAARAS